MKFLFNSRLGCFGLSGETEGNAGLGGGGCLMGGGGSVGRGPGVSCMAEPTPERTRYPDGQQLFVRKLPHNAMEMELRFLLRMWKRA